MQEEAPAYFLLEVSLSGRSNINDLTGLLDDYVGEDKPEVAKRVILGLLLHQYKAGRTTLRKAVRAIGWLALHLDYSPEENSFIAGLDKYYDLADEGICGTLLEIESFLLQFLTVYHEFHLNNRKDWRKLKATTATQLQLLHQHLKPW